MYDVWDVIGLRGTGTDSYSVDNFFIPERICRAARRYLGAARKRSALPASRPTSCSEWALPRSPSASRAPMLDATTDLARGKSRRGLKAMHENSAVQGRSAAPKAICARRAPISTPRRPRCGQDLTNTGKYTEGDRVGAAAGLDLDHPSGRRGGRHRLSHGGRDRGVRAPTSSSGVSATCMRSPSRSRPAIRIMRTSARAMPDGDLAKPPDGAMKQRPRKTIRPARPRSGFVGSRGRGRLRRLPEAAQGQDCWRCAG